MADATVVTQSPRPALSDLALTEVEPMYAADLQIPDLYTGDQPPSADELADPSLAVPVNPDLLEPTEEDDPYGLIAGWEAAGGMNLLALDTEAEHSDEHPGVVAPTCPADSYAAQDAAGNWTCVAQYGPASRGTAWFKWAVLIALGVLLIRK